MEKFSVVNLCALRVARLDGAGVPQPGADNLYTSDAFLQIGYQRVVETGKRITKKNGCGAVCLDVKNPDLIVGHTLTAELCQLDAELIEILTGATLITDGGHPIGFADPASDAAAGNGVSIEAWAYAYDGDSRKIDPVTGQAGVVRHVWPKVTWSLSGTATLQEDALSQQLTGDAKANSGFYDGPANDVVPFDSAFAQFLEGEGNMPAATNTYATLAAS